MDFNATKKHKPCLKYFVTSIIISTDKSQGYFGFIMVTPLLQRFPLVCDNFTLYNIIFEVDLSNMVCGYVWVMPQSLLFCGLGFPLQDQWRPPGTDVKCQLSRNCVIGRFLTKFLACIKFL